MKQFHQSIAVMLVLFFLLLASACVNVSPLNPAPVKTEMSEAEEEEEESDDEESDDEESDDEESDDEESDDEESDDEESDDEESDDEESEREEDPEFALQVHNSATFDNPTEINHKWFPLTQGTEYVYNGFIEDGGSKTPHQIIFTVTDLTKEVAGVNTVVAYILDYSDGELIEAKIAFYAQDNDGNVWYMGEYLEVYELGEIEEAPAWMAGLKGARAGIIMKAEPKLEMPSYAQGWGPAVGWSDRGRVVALDEQVCIPVGCYEDVLVTEEFSQTEPDALRVKYYAPGVGNIKVGWRGEDATRETLELTKLTHLDQEALAEVREAMFELDESAMENSKEVYAATAPLEYSPDPALVARFWDFDPVNFNNSTDINNEWMPMVPGTRWIYEGSAVDEENDDIDWRIEFTVTGLTKEIAGIRTVVGWIMAYDDDDEVIEKKIAFYAQDMDGNVWYFGEYQAEYENGEFVQANPWVHGIENARAGVKMIKEPELGMSSYYQGWGPMAEWSVYGQVDQTGREICVPVDCYRDVLVIAESSLGELDAYQLKYYVRGVGEVQVGWRGEDDSQEDLQLVELVRLNFEDLAEVNEMALELEDLAYETSQSVYGRTIPME